MFKRRKTVYLSIAMLLLFCNISFSENYDQPSKNKRSKIGLVLSGGGAKGFAYIGMLKVFQEVGLPIDYIGGTSIGSIMGGLYAIGYSPDEIQKMVEKQDWEPLLRDEIPRKFIAYEEKEFLENAIVSLPIKKRKIGLKRSMYKGQQINLLLNRYFSPAWNITDFSKLQIPFLCVGTDLFNGNAEVLTEGYLPMAVRASMSIPGYFSPTYYNGKYLVDGGIVNNYPAVPVKNAGAEFLIGGDVQSGLRDDISQLSSLTEIINQIVFFHAEDANKKADSLININIHFRVPAGMMDFTKYDTIIAYGESVARQYYDELKTLADSLNAIEHVPARPHVTVPLDSIDIANVIYKGNKDMSTIFLDNYFGRFKNSRISLIDLEDVITTVYGTRFFKFIFYELKPVDGGKKANLVLNMEEASPGYLSASIHYDFDYHGSIRVNGIFRNVFGNRSKLFGELVMGTNPRLRALYLISNGAKPGFGVEVDMYDFTFDYYEGYNKINKLSINNLKAAIFVTSTLNNLYSIRTGFEYEYFKFKQSLDINPDFKEYENFNSYGNVFVKFRADTRDKSYFSTTGFDAEFKILYAMTFSSGWVDTAFSNSAVMYVKFNNNVKLSPKLTLKPGLFAGWTFKQKDPPIQHWFGTGGLNDINYVSSFVPFTGVNFVQKLGLYSGILRLKLQYNVYGKLYFTLRSDFGATEEQFEEIAKPKNTMFGYGLTSSYNSFIGPIEFTVMGSNINPSVSFFVNVGFSF